MKIRITSVCLFVAIVLFAADFSQANSSGDINGDAVIGLPEAIYALGVTAGLNSQDTSETYDFKNYYFVDGSEFFYKKTYYDETNSKNAVIYEYAHHLAKEIDSQMTFIECWYSGYTYQEYYSIDDQNRYLSNGDYWNGWYDGPIQIGSNAMMPGNIFSSIYQVNAFPYWCEYKILGIEDVQTQAGLFKNCLKISKISSYKWGVLFSYYALNTGLIKQIYASDNESYTLELIGTLNGQTAIPENLSIKRYSGNWNISSPQAFDSITFYYLPQNGNIATLIFHNFPFTGQFKIVSLDSSDGQTFTPTNSSDTISATVSGSNLSGTYTYTYIDTTTQENKSIMLSFSGIVLQ
ncbi:MAG: hypothetical protein HQK75_19455 [Candidatus Magnetomorum sp.]|nr:hypothetical protein [Candidatus Magnetomorum sp.]